MARKRVTMSQETIASDTTRNTESCDSEDEKAGEHQVREPPRRGARCSRDESESDEDSGEESGEELAPPKSARRARARESTKPGDDSEDSSEEESEEEDANLRRTTRVYTSKDKHSAAETESMDGDSIQQHDDDEEDDDESGESEEDAEAGTNARRDSSNEERSDATDGDDEQPAEGGASPVSKSKSRARRKEETGLAASTRAARGSVGRSSKFDALRLSLAHDRYAYLRSLGDATPTAQPSRLQRLVKAGTHTLSRALQPKLSPNGLQFSDLEVDNLQLLPMPVPTCVLSVMDAKAVPDSGLEKHRITIRRARICLYDGVSFVGNAQTLEAVQEDPAKPWNWTFRADKADSHYKNATFYVRHQKANTKSWIRDLEVYLEVTMGVQADQDKLQSVSQLHHRKARQVDELATGWCTFPLLQGKATEQTLHVKLVGGTLPEPVQVRGPQAQRDYTSSKLLNRMAQKQPRDPMVIVKMVKVPMKEVHITDLLPPVFLIQPSLASFVVTYRQILGTRLHSPQGDAHNARLFSPVLAVLPRLLQDQELFAAFVTLWQQQVVKPACDKEDLVDRYEALHSCTLRMWPLMYSQNLLPPSLSSDTQHTGVRIKCIQEYMKQHPVAPLGQNPDWCNEPFDTSELSYRYADNIR
mmetsp:Transcript_39187/g.75120  ORF Transcript_39187/g.75120 Transcript_39187/m.75120 type:complete len:644 (+) Transcript_39187:48-1979(+)